jgi:hypothetical protein
MNEVHDLVYHGGGGFIWSEVWDMPISNRRYHIHKINEFLKKKAEAEEAAVKGKNNSKSTPDMSQFKPDIVSSIKKK